MAAADNNAATHATENKYRIIQHASIQTGEVMDAFLGYREGATGVILRGGPLGF